jgi:hypothetical protein
VLDNGIITEVLFPLVSGNCLYVCMDIPLSIHRVSRTTLVVITDPKHQDPDEGRHGISIINLSGNIIAIVLEYPHDIFPSLATNRL